jgi:hypothetical protein
MAAKMKLMSPTFFLSIHGLALLCICIAWHYDARDCWLCEFLGVIGVIQSLSTQVPLAHLENLCSGVAAGFY